MLLGLLCVGIFLVQLGVTVVNVARPSIRTGLDTTLAGQQRVRRDELLVPDPQGIVGCMRDHRHGGGKHVARRLLLHPRTRRRPLDVLNAYTQVNGAGRARNTMLPNGGREVYWGK
jgi:hypothetical protein